MFFGMCNLPATFQAMMDSIFKDLIAEGLIIVYMDNILIFAKDKRQLDKITQKVLQRLQENDLYLKPEKCSFEKTKIDYLGMIIEEGKISMDPTKLKGIRDWPVPKTVKQVRSFLGFGNFYRRFIRRYSDIVKPLNTLLQKNKGFIWNEEVQKSFETLKQKFTEEPVLMMPDTSKPFQIESDASKYASGAVLTQLDNNGSRHPCVFISKTFNEAEQNNKIYNQEPLAIIRSLQEWRHYIQGSPFETIVLSDHKNLTYFRSAQKLNRRQARWSPYLSEFNIKLIHTPGTKMVQSDSLSRRPDLCPEEDHDNENKVLLPEGLFVNLIDTELQQRIAKSDKYNMDAANAIKILLEKGPRELNNKLEEWTIEQFEGKNILFYQGRNYVPNDLELRKHIIHKYHDTITAGHPGELKTFNAVRRHYWWPGMCIFVKNYVKGCGKCQQFKINRNSTNTAFLPIQSAKSTSSLLDLLPPPSIYESSLF